MDTTRAVNPYCKSLCFPTTYVDKNKWKLETGERMGKSSSHSNIFIACNESSCDYVLKCIVLNANEKISSFHNEVNMQKVCASQGLCMPVKDWWECDDKQGGAIITEILDTDLSDWLESTPVAYKQQQMILGALILIYRLHVDAGIKHGDMHLNNIMLDRDGQMKIIDMGNASKFPIHDSSAERYKEIFEDYNVFLYSLTKHNEGGGRTGFYQDIEKIIKNELRGINTLGKLNTFNMSYYGALKAMTSKINQLDLQKYQPGITEAFKGREERKGIIREREERKMLARASEKLKAESKYVAEMEKLELRFYKLTGRRLSKPPGGWKMPSKV